MTWRDQLRRVTMPDGRRVVGASFRGVPFYVEEVRRTGGRRGQVHEYPLRDDPFVEDLGRRARTFPVVGYVLGDDYLDVKDALIEALEDVAGPGELVHPYYGRKKCICLGEFDVTESERDGGIARFSIPFQEAPAQAITPTEAPDLPGAVSLSADRARALLESDFAATFSVAGLPGSYLASASDVVKNMAGGLEATLGPIVESAQEAAKLKQRIDILTAQASSLVREPGAILGAFADAMGALVDTALGAPSAVLMAFATAYLTDTGTEVPETTVNRQRERANQRALDAALKGILAIEACRLAPQVDFETTTYALETRDMLLDMLDELSAGAGDAVYPALVQLRADVARAVPGDAALARVVTIERRVAVPSILLSYQLYGTTEREDDILARNPTSHPAFLSGELEVLSE